jgi:hypothetical protein
MRAFKADRENGFVNAPVLGLGTDKQMGGKLLLSGSTCPLKNPPFLRANPVYRNC